MDATSTSFYPLSPEPCIELAGRWFVDLDTTGPGPSPPSHVTLAALGDSYSSGNGTADAVKPCYRSPSAWPEPLPALKKAMETGRTVVGFQTVRLLACSGSTSRTTTGDIEDLPAQIAALGKEKPLPTMVTFTIGGDDGNPKVGFFEVLEACLNPFGAFVIERLYRSVCQRITMAPKAGDWDPP